MKKRLSLVMVLMMVLSLVPMSVFATAGSVPSGLVKVKDSEKVEKTIFVKLTQAGYEDLTAGKSKLVLNKGEFKGAQQPATFNAGGDDVSYDGGANYTQTSTTGAVTIDANFPKVAYVDVPNIKVGSKGMDTTLKLNVEFDEEDAGDITLEVSEIGTTGLDVKNAIKVGVVEEGQGDDLKIVVKDATKKIGFDGGKLSEVTLKDFDVKVPVSGVIPNDGASYVELELPDYMSWTLTAPAGQDVTKVTVIGKDLGAIPHTVSLVGTDNNIIRITPNAGQAVRFAEADSIMVEPVVKVNRREASKGDVSLKVATYHGIPANSTRIEKEDAVIGVVADYDVAMKAVEKNKKEIPALYGGEEATIKVKLDGVVGSFTKGRQIDFTVKGADVVMGSIKSLSTKSSPVASTLKADTYDTNKLKNGEFSLTIDQDSIKDFEFEFKIKTKYAQNGAATIEADSRDFGKIETEIAKVTPAYTVEFDKVTPIKKGESKATADIVIKEAKAGLFDTKEYIVLNLRNQTTANAQFAPNYKIETTNGLKIEDEFTKDSVSKRSDDRSIVLKVKTTSTKEAGTITLSNVVVNVDGSAVDGDKLLDTYVTEATSFTNAVLNTVSAASKDPDYAKAYITVVKEYGTTATTTVFKIGSKEYTVNGEAKTANEAPYVSGKGFTMLPVRAIGESLGLKADWNASTKTATFSNDSKVASVVIGADTMYVNGTPFKLSAKAEIKNGSTFVELRSLASAFGVALEWDAATKSVTIKG